MTDTLTPNSAAGEPSEDAARIRTRKPSYSLGAVSGMVAAGAALATGEVLSGFSRRIPSLLVAMFDVFVDYTPGSIVHWSIETFGKNQKSITISGIVIAALVMGVVLGIAALANRRIAIVGFAAFAVLGGWAAARTPTSAAGWSWFSSIVSASVGLAVLLALVANLPFESVDSSGRAGLMATPDRRRFLGFAGAATFWALFGSGLGRALRSNQSVEGAREALASTLGSTPTLPADSATLDAIEGIAPLVTPNEDFYRIDTAFSPPQVDPADWTLTIKGMVDQEVKYTFDELLAMEQMEATVTLSCVSNEVGGDLVGNAVWTGVSLATLLNEAGVQDGATQIVGRSVDDWTGGFPTEIAFDGRPAMVALTMNGEPLPIEHGFPARLVIPGLYGYVSATKWLKEIELTTWDAFDGYWIPRGWGKNGPIKTESRIDVPDNRSRIAPGPTAIAGVAWAGHRSVDAVEIRVDQGEWLPARLSEELSEDSWRQWMVAWDAVPGVHTIEVRATDGLGETQTAERADPAPDGATGHHTIEVRVDDIA